MEKVNKSFFFSVLADETTDVAKLEQLTVCLRYLDGNSVREGFLGFVNITDLSGKGLVKTILQFLGDLKVDMEGLVGQGYDGAAAMSGRLNGVQSIISEKYPSALYMHCASHCLNLTLTSSSTITDVRNTQGTIHGHKFY